MHALAIELDTVLADTRRLWRDWLDDATRRTHVELGVPDDRIEAAAYLDEQLGDWRPLLERFAADRAPVYFRPHGDTGAILRRLQTAGARLAVFTDAPAELAGIALAHVGAARRVEVVGTLDEVLSVLGEGTTVIRSRDELSAAASVYHAGHGAQ